jgi:Fe-S cluster assembly ATPase SufC
VLDRIMIMKDWQIFESGESSLLEKAKKEGFR